MSAAGVSIGNTAFGGPLNGEIDDVKIWRYNPHRMADEFFDRPMDDATIDCYKRFFKELEEAFRRHPECAGSIESTSSRLLDKALQEALGLGTQTQERLTKWAEEYRRLWGSGQAGTPEMANLLTDTMKWLQMAGMNTDPDSRFAELFDSNCWHILLREVTPPDCDPQLSELVRMVRRRSERESAF